jgi:hypothetical protein
MVHTVELSTRITKFKPTRIELSPKCGVLEALQKPPPVDVWSKAVSDSLSVSKGDHATATV